MTPSYRPTEAERDAPVKLDGDYAMEEAARILLAVKPSDLPTDDDDPEVGK